jgi:Phage integrase family
MSAGGCGGCGHEPAAAVLPYLRPPPGDPAHRLIRPGLGSTGATIEALGTERGHRTLTITRQGGKIVTIPLAPRTARAIDLAIGERCEGPVFPGPGSRRLDRHGAARIVRRVARRAGITKPVGPHMLRHAFTTATLDAGVPLRDVQEAASHADPRTTMRNDQAVPAWTGTPPTSPPPTLPVPPGSAAP